VPFAPRLREEAGLASGIGGGASAQETARECGFLARQGLRRSPNTAVFPGLHEQFGAEHADLSWISKIHPGGGTERI
jgi:hypothetical protein